MVEFVQAGSVIVAMVLVGLLAWHAISNGIDGAVFMTAVVVIGGLGGYELKAVVGKVKSKTPPEG